MFSTNAGGTTVYARTAVSGSGSAANPMPDVTATDVHTYRIEWDATQVRYYVDGTLRHTETATIATPMRVLVSDFETAAGGVTLEWIDRSLYAASGTFESRVFDSGKAATDWTTLVRDEHRERGRSRPGRVTPPHRIRRGRRGPPSRVVRSPARRAATSSTARAQQRRRGNHDADAGQRLDWLRDRRCRAGGRHRRRRGDRHDGQGQLLEHRHRRGALRVQPGRRSVRHVRQSSGVHGPRGRLAHGRRARGRSGRATPAGRISQGFTVPRSSSTRRLRTSA